MEFELRPITPEEYLEFGRVGSKGFGHHAKDEEIEDGRALFEFDRSLAAFDGGKIVGTGLVVTFELTVPGGLTVPAGGVTWISVLPTHRRRGILTAIMRQQFSDVRERGEPLAMLWASESIIYGRYGYGVSTLHINYEIGAGHRSFAFHPHIAGNVRLVDKEEASKVLPNIYERIRLAVPGALSRRPEYWDHWLKDPDRWHEGASARFYAVYRSESGTDDGYAAYRIKSDWNNGFPNSTLQLISMFSATDEARAALWKYCLNVDLVTKVEVWGVPNDEPLSWMLADPRRLRVTYYGDSLWTRLVDIPAALAGRTYATNDSLVFEIEDRFCPENSGRYRLEGSPDGAQCAASSEAADISLEVADLGAGYLGGVRFSTLAHAGRVVEHTSGALRRADMMFESEPQPYCTTDF
jgi:predicted acetyltransferase